jgi:hypothetical protein
MQQAGAMPVGVESTSVPLVSHHAALFEPYIRPPTAISMLHLPHGILQPIRTRVSTARRAWERFVAIRVGALDAAPMEPLVLPEAIALLDRHYTSLMAYRVDRPNLYAVRHGAHLTLRYVEYTSNRLVLRPQSLAFPVELIEIDPGTSPSDLIAGRVALILNET